MALVEHTKNALVLWSSCATGDSGCLTCADTSSPSPSCWLGFFSGVLLALSGIALAWTCARRCWGRGRTPSGDGPARPRPPSAGRSPTPVRRPPPSPATPPENLIVPGLPVPLLGRHDLANRQQAPAEPPPEPVAGYLLGHGAVPGANDGRGLWRAPCRECGLEQPGHPGHLCPLRGTSYSIPQGGRGFRDPAIRPSLGDPPRGELRGGHGGPLRRRP